MAEISIIIRAKSMLAQAFSAAGNEIAAFGRGITGRFKAMFSGLNGIAASFGAALSVGALVGFAKRVAGMGDDIEEGAKKLQTTTANFQSLNYAATQSGAKIENVQAGFVKFSTVMDDARKGSAEALSILGRLGLTLRDLEGKDTADQFRMIAAAINDLPDGDEKINLFKDALGKGGVEVAAMVANLDELEREFRDLGMAMDEAGVKAGGKFTDGLAKVQQQLVSLAASTGFLDYMNEALDEASAQLAMMSGAYKNKEKKNASVLSASDMLDERARLDKAKADRLKREKERERAAAIAAGASQQKLDEAEFKKSADLVAGAQARQDARRKAGQSDDYVDYRISAMTALDVALKGGADVVKMIMESEAHAREKQIKDEEELIGLKGDRLALEKEISQEITFANAEAARKAALDLYNEAEKGSAGLLFKPGTQPAPGEVGAMKSTKGILDDLRAGAKAKKMQERNEAKFRKLYEGALEKQDHGRWMSMKEKAAIAQMDNMMGQAQNAPGLQLDGVAEQQLSQLEQINAKIDKMAARAASG